MGKLELLKQMVAAEKKLEAGSAKVREEWVGKPLADFITSTDAEGNVTLLLPVLAISMAGGLDVYIEVPKFEGLHNRFRMSLRSKDGRPSEVARYKATAEYRAGLISCYTTQKNTKEGNRILHWHGLRLINLDDVRDAITQAPPGVRGPSTLIREQ